MTQRPNKIETFDLRDILTSEKVNIALKTAETPDEQASRLRREEAEDAHEQRIGLIVHTFVLALVSGAFLISAYLVVAKDPKTGLPDKAIGVITAIVAAGAGYITGKGSK